MKRFVGILAIVPVLAWWAVPAGAQGNRPFLIDPGKPVVFHTREYYKANRPFHSNNLTYNGGAVETTPSVYIVYWGQQWGAGFSTGGYTSAKAQTYNNDFFGAVGGSSWANIDSQYCQGVALGTINCGSLGTHIQNVTGQLAGTWTDTTDALPSNPSQTDIANEALRLVLHFSGTVKANATYFVYTPSGDSESGFATSWCAWHGVASTSYGEMPYAYMPYQPDAGSSCGENYVYSTDGTFGNGYFDGFSIVGGHEYAEAQTDPHTANGEYAWLDQRSSEIGDKCAWIEKASISLGGHDYAVQPLWSNAVSGCATGY